MTKILNLISLWALPVIILTALTCGIVKKVPIYEEFTEGAKDGFKISVKIIPYLVAIIVAISMLRASGTIEILANLLAPVLTKFNIPADTLPLMIVRSLSGSGALGIFSDIANNLGPDSYATKLSAIMVGSSETTFYVLAVYFGAIGIKKIKYALVVGLLADLVGIIAAISVCHWNDFTISDCCNFFHSTTCTTNQIPLIFNQFPAIWTIANVLINWYIIVLAFFC